MSERDIKRRGLDIQTDMPKDRDGDDVKPEEGWDYNPGATPLGDWKPKRKYADVDGNKILDSVKKVLDER